MECYESDLEHICDVEKVNMYEKLKMAAAAILAVAISSLFDHTPPNLVNMLQIRFRTHKRRQQIALRPKFKMATSAILKLENFCHFRLKETYHSENMVCCLSGR